MNEIVKYNNRLNLITFKNFLASDCDYFMFLCCGLREKGGDTIQFTFQDIRRAVNLRNESNDDLEEALLTMNEKILASTGRIKDGQVTKQFNLFNDFETDSGRQLLTVSVNPKYAYILNDFSDGFTKFEFQEFMLLSSKHSKTLYRLMKQWRTKGVYDVKVEDLKKYMDCPEMETRYFIRDVVKKALKELQEKECFRDLTMKTSRDKAHGGPLKKLTFTFQPEARTDPAADQKPKRTARKNSFDNFTPRQRTAEEWEELERAAMNWK